MNQAAVALAAMAPPELLAVAVAQLVRAEALARPAQ